MRRLLALAAVALVAGVSAAGVRADGDPASDFLLATQVFLPFDVKVSPEKKQELLSIVHAANKSGYAIRVAVIASPYDLGAITSLWSRPRQYARFLGAEITFVYKQRLLVVMPNGFGFSWAKHPSTREYAVLGTVPIGKGASGMVDSTVTAVQKLAAASGVKVAAAQGTAKPAGKGFLHDRVVIVLLAVAVLALAVLLRLVLRRKSP